MTSSGVLARELDEHRAESRTSTSNTNVKVDRSAAWSIRQTACFGAPPAYAPPKTSGNESRDVEEALKPDPGTEKGFEVADNPFAFCPGQLDKMIAPKSLGAFWALGGLRGLEKGLCTNKDIGLTVDEKALEGHRSLEEARKALSSSGGSDEVEDGNERADSSGSVPKGPSFSLFVYRRPLFPENRSPDKGSTGLWEPAQMVGTEQMLILILLTAPVALPLALVLYQGLRAMLYLNAPEFPWVAVVAITMTIVAVVGAANDWQKKRQLDELNREKKERTFKVVRSGVTIDIPVSEILVGDVVLLEPGDQVPVDGILVASCAEFLCDELSVTGASDLIEQVTVECVLCAIEAGCDAEEIPPHGKPVMALRENERVLEPVDTEPSRPGANQRYAKLEDIARLGPDEKRRLVTIMRALGEPISTIGKPVDGAPAVNVTALGLGKGVSGTEVAKEASEAVRDDSFVSIVNAIARGQAVNRAVKKYLQFHAIANAMTMVVTSVSAAAGLRQASAPTVPQLLMVNLIMDTFAALALTTGCDVMGSVVTVPVEDASPTSEARHKTVVTRDSPRRSNWTRLAVKLRRACSQPLLAAVLLLQLVHTAAAQNPDAGLLSNTAVSSSPVELFWDAIGGVCVVLLSTLCIKVAPPLFGVLMAALAIAWAPIRNDARTTPAVLWGVFGAWGVSTIVYGFTQFSSHRPPLGQLYLLMALALTVALLGLNAQIGQEGTTGMITYLPPTLSLSFFTVANIPTLLGFGRALVLHVGDAVVDLARLLRTRQQRTPQGSPLDLEAGPR